MDRESVIAYSVVVSDFGSGNATNLRDNGSISGTFNAPHRVQVQFEHPQGGFRMSRSWTFQDLTGTGGPFLAEGRGTATCEPCTVEGLTGIVRFDLTVLGAAVVDESGAPQGAENLGGTWIVAEAAGDLVGLTGQGTYNGQQPIVFIGRITLPQLGAEVHRST